MLPKNKKQWVLWKREEVKKQGVPTGEFTKVPYSISGRKASSKNKNTWSLYDEVTKIRHEYDGIGFVFDGSYLGIDLDHVLTGGKIEDKKSQQFINACDSLVEISPSGDGLHVYFKLTEPVNLIVHNYKPNEKIKYECYTEKRYFTVTENIFKNHNTLRTINSEEAYTLLSILGYPWKKKQEKIVSKNVNVSAPKNNLSDKDILRIMFSAKNGKKIQDVYNGSDTHHDNDSSVADASLCSMLAFYSNKNFETIERLWLDSPRGLRAKVKDRADYRKMTIDYAIQKTEEVFRENNENEEEHNYYVIQEGKKGETIIPIIVENIRYFLNTHKDFKGRFRFEEFKQVMEYNPAGKWKRTEDEDILFVMNKIARTHPYFARVGKEMVADAMLSCAKQYSYDEIIDYFTGLKWDKKPRIEAWLSHVFGVTQDKYHAAVGANWLKGLVKRAVEPGCKFDYVLVIEGKQGIKKSMALAELSNPWHTEIVSTPDNKDFFLALVGNLVVEFAEGETLSRAEMKKLKAVITMTHDDIRLPYARMTARYPRRCVFAMTTNEDQYLKDNTGNRRWLPVRAVFEEANVPWLKENRNQLFAEAYHRAIVLKETYWEFPKEETEMMQALRVIGDPQEELITEWYMRLPIEKKLDGVTTREAFDVANPKNSFGEQKKIMNKADQMIIAGIFKQHLYLVRRVKITDVEIRRGVYVPTEKTPMNQVKLQDEFANF